MRVQDVWKKHSGWSGICCATCRRMTTNAQYDYSMRHYDKPLCRSCQSLEKYSTPAEEASADKRVKKTGKKPKGRPPKPPTPGPRDKDQYNFTDPDSAIMKNAKKALSP
jgi:hypothetical protein